eukprot:jgi/Chlat1/51/ChrspC238745S08585
MAAAEDVRSRMSAALLGMFVGDALAMPVHWYYSTGLLKQDYGEVKGYLQPKKHHPQSMVHSTTYEPADADKFDILHDQAVHYGTKEKGSEYELNKAGEFFHYHGNLPAGGNTLNLQLLRLLMRTIVKNGGKYDAHQYLAAFRDFMLTAGSHKDTFVESYIRKYFEAYSRGKPETECAISQKEFWSIASMSGCLTAVPLTMLFLGDEAQAESVAVAHHRLFHNSETVEETTRDICKLLMTLLTAGSNKPLPQLHNAAARQHLPKATGDEMLKKYQEANSPYNIPADEMYKLHRDMEENTFDIDAALKQPVEEVLGKRLMTACYPEHGYPALLYLALKCGGDFEAALLANTNAGGDSVHRGALLGAVLGAAGGMQSIPQHLIDGLAERDGIKADIDAFVELASSKYELMQMLRQADIPFGLMR